MLILDDRKFVEVPFRSEAELEQVVVDNAEYIFGPSAIYFPKSLISTTDGTGTIPDGYVIDVAERRWYIVEAETSKHSVWSHIAPQVAKQLIAASNPDSKRLIADLALRVVKENEALQEKFTEEAIQPIDIPRAIDDILMTPPIVAMPIDGVKNDLRDWAATLKASVRLWIVRKFVEFGAPDTVLYEFPEEFMPVLDTEVENDTTSESPARFNVTVADLLEAGLLSPGQELSMTYGPRNGDRQTFTGTIQDDGSISVLGKVFTSPSYAAVFAMQNAGSTRKTENGWRYWRIDNGTLLNDIRERYLNSKTREPGENDA